MFAARLEVEEQRNMTLKEARAALLAELLGGDADPENQDTHSANLLDKHSLNQIVNGCFVKLQQLRLLQCDVCKKTFHKRSRFIAHYFDTHMNEDLKESDIPTGTRVDVENIAPVVRNSWRTDSNGLKLHPCNICDESFAYKVDMLIHKLKHAGKEAPSCEICQRLFINKTQLNIHIKTCHEENLYACDVCNKQFRALNYLRNHKKLHSDVKNYSCEFCEKKFANKLGMMKHRRKHTGETPYSCVCGRQFPYYSGLKCHRCVYRNPQHLEEDLQCDYCKKKYQGRSSLLSHIKWHMNSQVYACDHCKLKFNSPWGLKRHQAKHTGNLPYSCSVCDKKFAANYQLKRHMLTHTKKREYACEICDKRFLTQYTANTHLKVHLKSYRCSMCNKSFDRRRKLNKHLKCCDPKQTSVKVPKIRQAKTKKSKKVYTSDSSSSDE